MAYIKYSSDFLRGTPGSLQGRVINLYNGAYGSTAFQGSINGLLMQQSKYSPSFTSWIPSNVGLLRVMAGTIPSSVESLYTYDYDTIPPGTTQLCMAVSQNAYTGQTNFYPTGSNWYTDPTVISTEFVEATATGVATWFWLCTARTIDPNAYQAPQGSVHNIIGDVGTVGSGADMEMVNPSIVAGQFVRIVNLALKIPNGLFG